MSSPAQTGIPLPYGNCKALKLPLRLMLTIEESKNRFSRAAARIRPLWFVFAALGLLFVVVTLLPVDIFLSRKLAGPWNDPRGDILIVLGAGMADRDVLDETSYLRSRYALNAYRSGGFREIVISGGGNRKLAETMADFFRCHEVPPQAILLEARSTSTHENAMFTSQLLKNDSATLVLLTSDYHMFRAYHSFEKAGLHVLPRPIPDAIKRGHQWRQRWPAFLDLAEETVKIIYYWARRWI